jgi:hypothetical protein
VKHALSRALIDRVIRHARGDAGRFQLVWVLADRPAAIESYRERGGTLEGIVVPDATRAVRQALRVSVLPAVFAFDSQSRLVAYRRAPWPAGEELDEWLAAIPRGESAGPTEAAAVGVPAPGRSERGEGPLRRPQGTRRGPTEAAAVGVPARRAGSGQPDASSPAPDPSAAASVPATAPVTPAAAAPVTTGVPEVEPAALAGAWRRLASRVASPRTAGAAPAADETTIVPTWTLERSPVTCEPAAPCAESWPRVPRLEMKRRCLPRSRLRPP